MKTKIINISIPEQLLNSADELAKKECRNRSDLFREALRSYLISRGEILNLYNYGAQKAADNKIKESDVNEKIAEYRKDQ